MKSILKRTKKLSRAAWKLAFPYDFPPSKRKADGPSSHLRSYLEYYKRLREPGYAVMVTGEWGVGKTHQVEHALDEDDYHYISLYGLRTPDELRSAVFARMFPTRHRVRGFVDDAKQALRDASGLFAFGSLTPALLGAFLDQNVSNDRILVFDDLERCRISVKVLLGVINHYVEHSGCRVIVIVHDGRVLDTTFKDSKEKLFGQSIQALPQVDEAFACFMTPHRKTAFGLFMAAFESDVLEIFRRSEASSLRLLKYLIEDLRRTYEAIDEAHKLNPEAMREVVKLLSVYSVFCRGGDVAQTDLLQRAKLLHTDKGSIIARLADRYQPLDLASSTLQDELLVEMLVQGIYDREKVRKSLDESYHFLVPRDTPPWKTVINFDHLEDGVVEAALARMDDQVNNLEPIAVGEMLHILALRLMMAEQGISNDSLEQVVARARDYIDVMSKAGKIPALPLTHVRESERYTGHDGIAFWVSTGTQAHFAEILSHLKSAREGALDRSLMELAPELLSLMQDGEKFFETLVSTYTGKNPYAYVPVLSKIEPRTFVAAWLRAPKPAWYWIGSTVNERYKSSHRVVQLKAERPWAMEVVALLNEEAAKLEGFAKFRLLRATPKSVCEDEDLDQEVEIEVASEEVAAD